MHFESTYRGRRLARRPLAALAARPLAALAARRLAALSAPLAPPPTAHDAVDAASACAS